VVQAKQFAWMKSRFLDNNSCMKNPVTISGGVFHLRSANE